SRRRRSHHLRFPQTRLRQTRPHPWRARALRQRDDAHRNAGPGAQEKVDDSSARATRLAVSIARRRAAESGVALLPGHREGLARISGEVDRAALAVTGGTALAIESAVFCRGEAA